jgi:hypothetical protein
VSALEKFGWTEIRSEKSPLDPSDDLLDSAEPCDPTIYRGAVGVLNWLAQCSRPDIAFSVSLLASFQAAPTMKHWSAVKHVFGYLSGTRKLGVVLNAAGDGQLLGFVDASHGDPKIQRKSTSGNVFFLSGGPISWQSSKQKAVAISSSEAEYVAISKAAQQAVWLKGVLLELGIDLPYITLHADSRSGIAMTQQHTSHERTKHIAVRYHHVRELVREGVVKIVWVEGRHNWADMLTKIVQPVKHFVWLCGAFRGVESLIQSSR